MKKTKVFLLSVSLLFSSLTFGQYRGDLISDSLLLSLDQVEILNIYADFNLPEAFFPIDYESVEIHKLIYWTINAHGDDMIEASGLITIPIGYDCEYPLLNFNHGTLDYDRVLSDLNANAMQHFIGVPFAANGYVSVLPDFLGYGETPVSHPHAYVHAKSEATAVVDMLRASREFCNTYDIGLNDQVFLLGYSHGGHVTMSAHRELQEFHSDEFDIVASAPSSGAYDLSGIMLDSTLYSDYYSNPFYIAFSTISFQYLYGDIYDNISDVFVAPYDSIIPLIFNRESPEPFWRDSLPLPGYQILQPDFIDNVIADSMHPFNVALRENDVYNWIPEAPLHLYYCEADEQIPFVNAIFTKNHMQSLGASEVSAISVGIENNHADCAFPAIINAKVWFDNYREECIPSNIIVTTLSEQINLYPNPFSEVLFIDIENMEENQKLEVNFYDLVGRLIYSERLSGSGPLSIPKGLASGGYLVKVSMENQNMSRLMVKVE